LMIKYRASGNDQKTISQGSTYLKFVPIPEEFSLHQNYPNPFNPVTTIQYDIPIDSKVLLLVYDIQGRVVKTLVNSEQSAGYKSIRWNGTNDYGQSVSAGMYFYHLQTSNFSKVLKMVFLK
ncbi:MAG: FlgD immunoglobulin-like domain containing protein, partial [Candidatus Neomarinimicrobiota bacterium]|nr:FlgD immunoglobulin-like domain containing protein [Candidatus Neomarinimicrobiota bacterium]